ncbi:hypothetical protein B9479_004810 [Cryptococcus floricola]|uniref:Uncharacterized protein n=1 Tax=Cryptococcus floricola TaxID=2591691 RepID=A0A5D3AXB3_9TREE|nr:hypothetical protein B9479_004810 [Cryptococcus floricola]
MLGRVGGTATGGSVLWERSDNTLGWAGGGGGGAIFRGGIHVLNVGKTWDKLVLAARILATIENPNDVWGEPIESHNHA